MEAALVAGLGTVLIGLVLSVLWWGVTSFGRSEERLDPREQAHLALATIRSELADAGPVEVVEELWLPVLGRDETFPWNPVQGRR